MTKVKLTLIVCLSFVLFMSWLAAWHEVVLGAVAQWGSHNYDALLVLPPTYPPRQRLAALISDNQGSLPFQVGRVVGSTVAVVQGVSQMMHGATLTGGGVLAGTATAETGVGSIVGYGVAVVGAVEAVHGGLVVVHGVVGLVESTGRILNMAAKGGGSGGNITPKAGDMTKISEGLARQLKQAGYDPHTLKRDIYGKNAPIAHYDIYKDNQGNLYTNDKTGKGAWISLDLNINDIIGQVR